MIFVKEIEMSIKNSTPSGNGEICATFCTGEICHRSTNILVKIFTRTIKFTNCSDFNQNEVHFVYCFLPKSHEKNSSKRMYKAKGQTQWLVTGQVTIPAQKFLQPVSRPSRHHNSKAFKWPSVNKDCLGKSFFPRTIAEWNSLPEPIINIENKATFKNQVTKHLHNNSKTHPSI